MGYREVFSVIEFERANLDDMPAVSLPAGVELRRVESSHYRSYDLYQSVGFRRIAEFGRYRKPVRS